MDPLGLPERTGIGTLGAVAEPVGIATARGHACLNVTVVAALLLLHPDRRPRRAVDQDEAHPLRLGCPDPPPDRTVPRPDRPASPRLPTTRSSHSWRLHFASFKRIAIDQTVGIGSTTHPGPLAAGSLLALGILPVIPSRVALSRLWTPGEPRMLGEVAQVARPGARRSSANRAEYRIPQPAIAHHALALYRLYMRSSWQIRLTAMPDDEVSKEEARHGSHGSNRAAVRPAFDAPCSPTRGIRSQLLELHTSPYASRVPLRRRAVKTTGFS